MKSDCVDRFTFKAYSGFQQLKMTKGSFNYKDKRKVVKFDESKCNVIGNVTEYQLTKNGSVCVIVKVESIDASKIDIVIDIKDKSINRFNLYIPSATGEHYYGCGETFTKFDLKGEKVRVWVAEHQNANRIAKKVLRNTFIGKRPSNSLPFDKYESYYVQPTFISSSCYYMHVDTTEFTTFDFTKDGLIGIEVRDNCTIHYEKAEDFESLATKLSNLLGRQKELPDWVYDGMILGIQQGPEVIDKKIAECKKHNVPVIGIWSQDWCGCRRTAFGYQVMWNWKAEESIYPNLSEKIKEWNAQGIKFLGYINPFIALEKDLYKEAHEKGYCVKNDSGDDYLVTITTFPAAMVDFTNPEAYEWYKNIIKNNMIGAGLSGWMADFGEYLPVDAVLHSGVKATTIHNEWPAIWARLNREAIEETGNLGKILFFTRAGYTGTIKNSVMMWNGDQHVDFSIDDGIGSVIPASLSLTVSGYGISHSDVGGYTTMKGMTRSRELMMRWEELSCFSPLMRSHEGNQPIRNVHFSDDEELLKQLGKFTRIHKELKPYLKEAVSYNADKGVGVMRPLFYYYNEDKAYTEGYEYLLGRDILVSPVLKENETKHKVYLPMDNWINVFTGKAYKGGEYEIEAPIGQPPVFIRQDSKWKDQILNIIKGEA